LVSIDCFTVPTALRDAASLAGPTKNFPVSPLFQEHTGWP